jgi:hypothetical protein
MRGRDRSPHPTTPCWYRRSPSDSHPGALVPVSRATHTWAASSPRGGRLQHLGGVASTHRTLPSGGERCRLRRFPGDWPGSPCSVLLSFRSALRCTSRRDVSSAGLKTPRFPSPQEGWCLASLTLPLRSTVMPSSALCSPGSGLPDAGPQCDERLGLMPARLPDVALGQDAGPQPRDRSRVPRSPEVSRRSSRSFSGGGVSRWRSVRRSSLPPPVSGRRHYLLASSCRIGGWNTMAAPHRFAPLHVSFVLSPVRP